MSAVAVKLADCANDDGENVYPSVGRIERETRQGAATVRRVLAAFEQAGLLEVVDEVAGNKWNRSTTIRRFNLVLLHDLSAVEKRVRDGHGRPQTILTPSTHVLKQARRDDCKVEATRRAKAEQRRAEGKPVRDQKDVVVCDCCPWAIVPRGPDDVSDYATDDDLTPPPLPEREGCGNSAPPGAGGAPQPCPSRSGSPPLPEREGTPPGAGANPSLEPSLELPPSPPMGGERERPGCSSSSEAMRDACLRHDGWARGWTDPAREAVAALRSSTPAAHVASHLVDPVRGTLRPQKGADAAAYVRQLGSRLRTFRPDVLARTAQVLLDTRGGYLPDAASVERTARTVEATLRHEVEAAAKREARAQASPPADPTLAAKWPELRAALVTALTDAVVASWFDGLAIEALASSVLTLRAESAFKARWIATHYDAALLTAARQVLGLVSRVIVVSERGATPQASGVAA